MKDKREPESNRWLLIKAGESMKPLSKKADDTSAISGRSMAAIAKDNDAQWESHRPGTKIKSQRIAPKKTGVEAEVRRADEMQGGDEIARAKAIGPSRSNSMATAASR